MARSNFRSLRTFLSDQGDISPINRTVCVVTNELAELHQNGGIGTATSGLIRELAKRGNDVHVLYTARSTGKVESVKEVVSEFSRNNIRLTFLESEIPSDWIDSPRKVSYACFELLRRKQFEVIHFNDYLGNGFYTGQAKSIGLAFTNSIIISTVHGVTKWASKIDQKPMSTLTEHEISFLELKSLEHSDVVIGVSAHLLEWLREEDVALPRYTFLHKNILPPGGTFRRRAGLKSDELAEVVFFGRQDVRKGFRVFLDAVRRVSQNHKHIKFSFLGKFSRIEQEHSGALALDVLRSVSNLVCFYTDYDRDKAIDYLRRPGVLAVMPSLDENSPCTVIECIEAGIPFLASDVGGIPELIEKSHHKSVLFTPTGAALAAKIENVIEAGVEIPKLGFNPTLVADDLCRFFELAPSTIPPRSPVQSRSTGKPLVSVCITHFNRSRMLQKLLAVLERQTYDMIEVIVVDDGSTNQEDIDYISKLKKHRFPLKVRRIKNSYLGAARNEAARIAEGRYLKFQDDDNLPLPHEIETLVDAALFSGADIVTAFAYFFRREDELREKKTFQHIEYFPLGASLPLSLFRNEYGDANALVLKETFDRLGGFTEEKGIGAEDYEFFAKAELNDFIIRTVPIPLFFYRVNENSMLQTTSLYQNAKRARRPFLASPKAWVAEIIDFAQDRQLQADAELAAWFRAGKRMFGTLHQQLLAGDPNSSEAVQRFVDLAAQYERFEDVLPMVLRTSKILESLRWLEESARRIDNGRERKILKDRPRFIDLADHDRIEQLEPADPTTNFALVKRAGSGIMVHPLTGRETKALLTGVIPPGTKRISVSCFHSGVQGHPLKMAVEVLRLGKRLGKSDWLLLMPGERAHISVDLRAHSTYYADLIVKSTADGSQDFGWAIAEKLTIEGSYEPETQQGSL